MELAVLDLICRLILGLLFVVFGWNGFLHRIPIPPADPRMSRFIAALEETGFLMPTVKIVEILAGTALLVNTFVPLALILLGPVVFVIVGAQLALNRGRGWGISALTLIPYLLLLGTRARDLAPLFHP